MASSFYASRPERVLDIMLGVACQLPATYFFSLFSTRRFFFGAPAPPQRSLPTLTLEIHVCSTRIRHRATKVLCSSKHLPRKLTGRIVWFRGLSSLSRVALPLPWASHLILVHRATVITEYVRALHSSTDEDGTRDALGY
ncbi:hypothetical protein L873DRAFT_1080959 [Choiromyces venosus 120613-1]|uniref:Uncharacterized protein n=1 Tax=Choiromyces venosus 120613-1 TaxID=1336337 RepID=A0A3N4JI63_9PEZI|nr:hypothetical protein L873DRAFT_1080959 [Choiromyces venosus 120613-1]